MAQRCDADVVLAGISRALDAVKGPKAKAAVLDFFNCHLASALAERAADNSDSTSHHLRYRLASCRMTAQHGILIRAIGCRHAAGCKSCKRAHTPMHLHKVLCKAGCYGICCMGPGSVQCKGGGR